MWWNLGGIEGDSRNDCARSGGSSNGVSLESLSLRVEVMEGLPPSDLVNGGDSRKLRAASIGENSRLADAGEVVSEAISASVYRAV